MANCLSVHALSTTPPIEDLVQVQASGSEFLTVISNVISNGIANLFSYTVSQIMHTLTIPLIIIWYGRLTGLPLPRPPQQLSPQLSS